MGKKVMIVDDNDITCLILSEILSKHSINAQSLPSAEKALSFLYENASNRSLLPDIIFLDINLPAMSGWDFLYEYGNEINLKDITIYIISSSISHYDAEQAKKYDHLIKGYLLKPVMEEDIAKALLRAFS